tara:strand:+ start:224 stop:445 length:222 start_codon:yes stop_codon:yes gene_type:complete
MLNSYKRIRGITIRIWLMGSGGVSTAPRIRAMIMANFLYSRKNAGVKIPIRVKNTDITGSWKRRPLENIIQRI